MKTPRGIFCTLICLFAAVATPSGRGENANEYVSRKEYDELKQQLLALKRELDDIKQQKTADSKSTAAPAASSDPAQTAQFKQPVEPNLPFQDAATGTTKFDVAGYAAGTFQARNHNVSTFSANFAPIFLWELSPKLLFEGGLELNLESDDLEIELEFAQLTYLLNDYITLGAGEFLAPSNVFVERFEPLWINKLPDKPLAVYDGILPEKLVGAEIRGSFPLGALQPNYAFYVANGPKLITDSPDSAGMLDWNNFRDNNDDKAVGGRVGLFVPRLGIEAGYGFETARPGDQGTSLAHLRSWLHTADLNLTRDSDLLKGRIDLHAQYAWTRVDRTTYDPTGSLGFGPISFRNKRDGGYAQIAYRPTKWNIDWLRNFEGIFRWDHLNNPGGAPGAVDEERWTLGIDYWLGPSTALKLAYEWDNLHGEPNNNAVLVQAVMGF